MRRKVSTILDEGLFRRAKLEAARQDRPMAEILEEALSQYFASVSRNAPSSPSAVADSWGALPLPASLVGWILAEEDGWLDS